MGLLDYYRRYADIDAEDFNRGLRERRARERAQALARVPVVDLSGTEWPELPNSEVANAAIAMARGRINGYPDPSALALRNRLAERHELDPAQVVLGNGAAELLQTAAYLLLAPGEELVTAWPSYPLFPAVASRAGARVVAVDTRDGAPDPDGPARRDHRAHARARRSRAPTTRPEAAWTPPRSTQLLGALGEQRPRPARRGLRRLPDAEPVDACLRLVERHPRLLVLPDVLEGVGALRAARRVRGRRARGGLAARGDRAGARGERAHPGRR